MFWAEGLPITPNLAFNSHSGFKSGGIASPIESSQLTVTFNVPIIGTISPRKTSH